MIAKKSLQLYQLPRILLVCLKRFKSSGKQFLTKNEAVVGFPVQGLSLDEFVLGEESRGRVYDLIGVSNHMGGMGGGHYTATARVDGRWHYLDDSQFREKGPEPDSYAYVLVYRLR